MGVAMVPEAIFKKLKPMFYGQLQTTSQTASVFQLFALTRAVAITYELVRFCVRKCKCLGACPPGKFWILDLLRSFLKLFLVIAISAVAA